MSDTAAGGATEATRVTLGAVARLDGAVQNRLRQLSRGRLRELIPRAIDGKFRMCIPPEPDDDDLILAALIDEALASRAELVALRAVAVAAEAVSCGVDSGDTRQANLLRDLDAALDAARHPRGLASTAGAP